MGSEDLAKFARKKNHFMFGPPRACAKNPNKYLFFFTYVILLIVMILGPVQIFPMIQKVLSSPSKPLHSLETPLLLLVLLLGNDPAFCHQILTMYLVRCFSIFCFFIISSRDMFNSGLSSNASMFVVC
jgi:hypothetical protein